MKKNFLKILIVVIITILLPNCISYFLFDYTFIGATFIAAFLIAGLILYPKKKD
jgi:cation transporter-like permease